MIKRQEYSVFPRTRDKSAKEFKRYGKETWKNKDLKKINSKEGTA